MNFINRLLTIILGKKDNTSFEDKVVLSCILYSGMLCFVSIFGNWGLQLNKYATYVVAVFSIFYSAIYVLDRFFKKTNSSKIIFSISTFVFCDALWLFNYGSHGAAMYIFLAYYCSMIFVWDNTRILVISILVVANVIFLFWLELSFPNIIPKYPTELARISDSYSSLLIFISVFAILALSAKHNYIKQFKKAQQSDKLKTAFLANMSHEIRTPLNAILGFSQLIATQELSSEKKEKYAKLIDESGLSLMTLVSEILDVSLIESGQLKIKITEVELNNLFNRLLLTYEQELTNKHKKDINLQLQIPSEEITIKTDPIRLEQIMENLLNNAIKFTTEGFIKFGFQYENNKVLFFVEDSGIGIKPEFLPYVFDRFVKSADNNGPAFARGAGLGLSLSKELVTMLKGNIWVNSEYMSGTIFAFILPVEIDA
ncbi:MAG: HAMP domain-containing sensor histidine kinase [Bacteroidota bacterium]|nr:HAMP domain-containing sensor histidine kinase [Bacteroidota bacterium]